MQNAGCRGMLCRVHWSYRGSLNIEVEVLEPGVGGSLPAGDELSSDGHQHDVVEFQGGQGRGVVVPGADVSGPQG